MISFRTALAAVSIRSNPSGLRGLSAVSPNEALSVAPSGMRVRRLTLAVVMSCCEPQQSPAETAMRITDETAIALRNCCMLQLLGDPIAQCTPGVP
jgi:hypothetical protein